MNNPEHKDILGQPINVGDHVVYGDRTNIRIWVVKKINPKMITIENKNRSTGWRGSLRRYPNDLLVIKDNKYLTTYLLKQ